MSGASSSAAGWSTRLEPASPPADLPRRPDDPRLGEVVEFWQGRPESLRPGRAVLVGFPQDEGVRRNLGRPGAAEAPAALRHWLYRLTPWDGEREVDITGSPPLDLGDVRPTGTLEEAQAALGEVLGGLLRQGTVPVILGGGHETAYGHYLGCVAAGRPAALINLDAHLDVRPCLEGKGHSGSPFRQALEHPTHPLPGDRYVCLGAQPSAVGRAHRSYTRERGCVVRWADEVRSGLVDGFIRECGRLTVDGCQVHLSVDADVVRAADVPGVSAPNPAGLAGEEVLACARAAGARPGVAGLELVEINPRLDRDGQSARWGALLIWHFLMGLGNRTHSQTKT